MMPPSPFDPHPLPRRRFLLETGMGLGALAMRHLFARQDPQPRSASGKRPYRPHIEPGRPYAPRVAPVVPRAKQVLVIFCSGAVSSLDTWDYKPELIRHHGKSLPGSEKLITFQGEQGAVTKSPWTFRQRGQSGKWISDLVPHLGSLADEMCFVHSMVSKTNTHAPGENYMSTGYTQDGFPSLGAWVTYALGSEDQSLPAYVAIPDPRGRPQNSVNNWAPGFLPASFQGTDFNAARPIRNLARPKGIGARRDEATRTFLRRLDERHAERFGGDSQLAARIASYELAARMQQTIPEVADLSDEPAHILKLYGAESEGSPIDDLRAGYARNCILARRLIERGVRCVEVFNGAYQTGGEGVSNWDGHKDLYNQYRRHGRVLDQPTAGLLTDLEQRGLLDQTLVVWCTEFGRMPTFQKGANGRDHNPDGFTCWLAGAGVKKGYSHGATDEFGHKAVSGAVSVHDFHATILHLLGLDHERLTYYHNGLERRLTDVEGRVVQELLL
ncbi:MAG: hypothetical protein ACI89X_001344 [Planctomycetota bacterium]|jgi:hypothetical protein